MAQKTALICGAGGFIGNQLVKRYKKEGYWVRAVSTKYPQFEPSQADEYILADLRNRNEVQKAFSSSTPFDEVCQLAATIGGGQFIAKHPAAILHDSTLINLNVLNACQEKGVGKVFYPSSACVYPSSPHCSFTEESAYPAHPSTDYGWEKIFGERSCQAFQQEYGMDIRIARIFNVFGIPGPWEGGREKAPAALCRKIAKAKDGDTIEILGDGNQTRSFLDIEDCVEGIRRIMLFPKPLPILNLGSDEKIAIHELVHLISHVANKKIFIKYIPDESGLKDVTSENSLIKKTLKWNPQINIKQKIKIIYTWIEKEVKLRDCR